MADDLVAARYSQIADRGKYASLPAVRRELKHVIDAPPTSLHPLERRAYLETILGDLEPAGGSWITWPEDVHLLALTAIKVLGRNPVGSKDVLIQPDNLATLVFHTSLPVQMPGLAPASPLPSSASGHSRGHSSPSSPGLVNSRSVRDGVVVPPPPASRPAMEALRALGNALVLHPPARTRVARLGVAEAVARALQDDVKPDRLFLLCRVGFLVTVDSSASEAIRAMVDDENIVPRLVHHLNSVAPIEPNYDTLTELLKLIGNVLRSYPPGPRGLDPRLATLHFPLLACMYQLELRDLRPPMTTALHALFYIPFDDSTLATWYSVPGGFGPTALRPSPLSRPSTGSTTSSSGSTSAPDKEKKRRGLFGKKRRDSSATKPPEHLAVPERSDSNSPASSTHSSAEEAPRHIDIGAFPRRVLDLLNAFVQVHLPGNAPPSSDLQLDDILPPILLLAANAANGSEEMRHYFRGSLLPSDLDRSVIAGPLELRPGLLGTILRLLNDTTHTKSRDTAGEFLWAIAGDDASVLCDEVGYGNVAGLLFRKGMGGPPPAKLEALDDAGEGVLPHSPPRPSLHPFAAGGGRGGVGPGPLMRSGSGGHSGQPTPPPQQRPPASPRSPPSPRPSRGPTPTSHHPWAAPAPQHVHYKEPSQQQHPQHGHYKESSQPHPGYPGHYKEGSSQSRHGPHIPNIPHHLREQSRPSQYHPKEPSYHRSPPHRPAPLPPQPQSPTQLPYAAPSPQSYYSTLPHLPPSRPPPPPPPTSLPPPPPHQRHPITALNREPDGPSPFAGLSDAEREREAEKMFVLFERMERNPILKAGAPMPDGGQRSLREEMHARVQAGDAEQWERMEAERERRARETQEEADEREAMMEIARYRQRWGK